MKLCLRLLIPLALFGCSGAEPERTAAFDPEFLQAVHTESALAAEFETATDNGLSSFGITGTFTNVTGCDFDSNQYCLIPAKSRQQVYMGTGAAKLIEMTYRYGDAYGDVLTIIDNELSNRTNGAWGLPRARSERRADVVFNDAYWPVSDFDVDLDSAPKHWFGRVFCQDVVPIDGSGVNSLMYRCDEWRIQVNTALFEEWIQANHNELAFEQHHQSMLGQLFQWTLLQTVGMATPFCGPFSDDSPCMNPNDVALDYGGLTNKADDYGDFLRYPETSAYLTCYDRDGTRCE